MKNKYKLSLPLLFTCIIWLAPANLVKGMPVTIDNGTPDLIDAKPSDFDYTPSLFGLQKQSADDFLLTDETTINSIEWWGIYFSSNTASASDNFTIRIFPDTAGVPASTTSISPLIGTLTQTDTGDDFTVSSLFFNGTFDVYKYSLTLDTPPNLATGSYWLSIVNDTTNEIDDWFWSTSNASGNAHGRVNDGDSWTFGIGNEMAFNLQGSVTSNTTNPVPEPSILTLISLGLLAIRRRLFSS
ncbi:DUF7901 domain-containing protein [Methylohalobius crimeensis]|uniref:DUF7901 domain-containing protein n=1 Tax=Methylohalobius crimeensis TaxID=244365 RepID=UPI0003B6A598|nr:PEP-CTERM sorting domain-containing protein [Methylohalobius crimeensis]